MLETHIFDPEKKWNIFHSLFRHLTSSFSVFNKIQDFVINETQCGSSLLQIISINITVTML